jgi:hypothetical protein
MDASGDGTKNMEQLRTEIWDFVFTSGPQTINEIAERLRLNQETVDSAVDHEWFQRQGETIAIATNQGIRHGQESNDV